MATSTPDSDDSTSSPRVSVLVACFRHRPFLEACLASIAGQEGVSFEILARDDGSDDGTAELLERLAPRYGVRLLEGGSNLGVAGSLNRMLELARGEYVVDFASDDIMPADRLRRQVEWLDAHPEAAACTGQCRTMDPLGNVSPVVEGRFLNALPEADFREIFTGSKELHGATGMIRASLLRDALGWDSSLGIEDLPLWLTLSRRHGPIGVLPDVLVHWRQHGSNAHLRFDHVYAATLASLERHHDHPDYPEARMLWRMRWWSAVAGERPLEALRRISELGAWRWEFLKRIPKAFLALLAGRWG
ncbi:MAG: glycosyltransferase [Fibrobacteria bacterium]|nr:glycosyltransferase [Fibrobacteria bacterium]